MLAKRGGVHIRSFKDGLTEQMNSFDEGRLLAVLSHSPMAKCDPYPPSGLHAPGRPVLRVEQSFTQLRYGTKANIRRSVATGGSRPFRGATATSPTPEAGP